MISTFNSRDVFEFWKEEGPKGSTMGENATCVEYLLFKTKGLGSVKVKKKNFILIVKFLHSPRGKEIL